MADIGNNVLQSELLSPHGRESIALLFYPDTPVGDEIFRLYYPDIDINETPVRAGSERPLPLECGGFGHGCYYK